MAVGSLQVGLAGACRGDYPFGSAGQPTTAILAVGQAIVKEPALKEWPDLTDFGPQLSTGAPAKFSVSAGGRSTSPVSHLPSAETKKLAGAALCPVGREFVPAGV
jgi:hypothetical protein